MASQSPLLGLDEALPERISAETGRPVIDVPGRTGFETVFGGYEPTPEQHARDTQELIGAQKQPSEFVPKLIATLAALNGNFGPLMQLGEQQRKTQLAKEVTPHIIKANALVRQGKLDEAQAIVDATFGAVGSRNPEVAQYLQAFSQRVAKTQEDLINAQATVAFLKADTSPDDPNFEKVKAMEKIVKAGTPIARDLLVTMLNRMDIKTQAVEGGVVQSSGASTRIKQQPLQRFAQQNQFSDYVVESISSEFKIPPNEFVNYLNAVQQGTPFVVAGTNVADPASGVPQQIYQRLSELQEEAAKITLAKGVQLGTPEVFAALARFGRKAVAFRELGAPAGPGALSGAASGAVDPIEVAILGNEGSGDASISPKGARGKFQIMEATGRAYGVTPDQLLDAKTNQRVGRAIIADLKALYPDRPDLQLAAYFSGPDNIKNGRIVNEKLTDGNMTVREYVDAGMRRLRAAQADPGFTPQTGALAVLDDVMQRRGREAEIPIRAQLDTDPLGLPKAGKVALFVDKNSKSNFLTTPRVPPTVEEVRANPALRVIDEKVNAEQVQPLYSAFQGMQLTDQMYKSLGNPNGTLSQLSSGLSRLLQDYTGIRDTSTTLSLVAQAVISRAVEEMESTKQFDDAYIGNLKSGIIGYFSNAENGRRVAEQASLRIRQKLGNFIGRENVPDLDDFGLPEEAGKKIGGKQFDAIKPGAYRP